MLWTDVTPPQVTRYLGRDGDTWSEVVSQEDGTWSWVIFDSARNQKRCGASDTLEQAQADAVAALSDP